jgi:hypothetical protein
MEQEGQTFQNLADGNGTRGLLIQNNRGTIRNIGGRFREELEFIPKWILAGGLGFEQSMISIQSINFEGATPLRVNADRTYYNWAPEMSLTWKPGEGYRHWVRASTGYGIPQFNNLLRDPVTGLPGTNFDLKPQKNLNWLGFGRSLRMRSLHKRFRERIPHPSMRTPRNIGESKLVMIGARSRDGVSQGPTRISMRNISISRIAPLQASWVAMETRCPTCRRISSTPKLSTITLVPVGEAG